MPDFLPRREADLLQWSTHFDRRINESPADLGLSPQEAADYRARHEAFAAAYQLARQPATRTASVVVAKDDARAAVVALARVLAGVVRANPAVTDAQRIALGLRVRTGPPSRIGPPQAAPGLVVVPLVGRKAVRVRLFDPASPTRRAKPRGVAGAAVFAFVGEAEPGTSARWVFCRNTTRTTADIDLPPGVPPGAAVWVAAHWFNPTGRRGPASPAVPTRLAGGWAPVAA